MDCPKTSYHSHSVWSDGVSRPVEMIAAAEALGFREYGLSDHLVLHPELPDVEWAMPLRLVDEYASAVRMAARAVGDRLRVRVGVEVDFSPDNPRRVELERILDRCGFDFRIGSIHYLGRFPVDGNAADWERLSPGERDEMHRGYWLTVKALAEQAEVDWIGHLDLPKKFGFGPAVDLSLEVGEALDAIANAGLAVELNTAGWNKPCAEPYPSAALLRECRAREIPVLINDDSHAPDQLQQHYGRAVTVLTEAGYTELYDPFA